MAYNALPVWGLSGSLINRKEIYKGLEAQQPKSLIYSFKESQNVIRATSGFQP